MLSGTVRFEKLPYSQEFDEDLFVRVQGLSWLTAGCLPDFLFSVKWLDLV
jgi:hypothetical protein